MRIKIINLATSADRLAFQTRQFTQLGLRFERLEAQTINDFSQAQFDAAAYSWERPMSKAEFACYLSHKKAWLDVIKSNEPTLILEDDAYLSHLVPSFLQKVASRKDCDFITLEARARKKVVSKQVSHVTETVGLKRLYLDRSGAAAYVLWPSGAKHLLDLEQRRGVALADAQICRAFTMRSYQAHPAIVVQADRAAYYQLVEPFKVESTISNSPRVSVPLESKALALRFKIKRVVSQLRMAGRILLSLSPNIERVMPTVDSSQFTEIK